MGGTKISIDDLASVTGGRLTGGVPQKNNSTLKAGKSGSTMGGNTPGSNTLSGNNVVNSMGTKTAYCPSCKEETVFDLFLGGRAICTECGEQITL